MIQQVWFLMVAGSIFYASITGGANKVLSAAMQGTRRAVEFTLELCAGYLLFCGLMEIAKGLRVPQKLNRVLRPAFRLLLPEIEKSSEAAVMNLSMNMLGLGNAATPLGMEAMRQMDAERKLHPEVRHDMYMLLILNATSLQLLPTTVLTMRIAAGSANANAILLPTLLCTAVSTIIGAAFGIFFRRKGGK